MREQSVRVKGLWNGERVDCDRGESVECERGERVEWLEGEVGSE